MAARYQDRAEAGRRLAARLTQFAGRADVIVLALPRGGVPVGYEVAASLDVPLDVFVVRKLGVPWQPEVAMGAVASGSIRIIDRDAVEAYGVREDEVARVTATAQVELARRELQYRGDRPLADLTDRTILLVDDGLATGATMRAAVEAVRGKAPARIVVAVPVAAPETCETMSGLADELICAVTPEPFYAVGFWYGDFAETTDEQVRALLARARERIGAAPAAR